ncbi:MAG: Rrf2 family transcriptional regulator [Altibacter sp.]|uniref:RrF2 family transcriptional regulator n=1 Tax=Altibacter lentus TaxID=1223410 RepID=UPI0005554A50|nr:Rrf2 family transcriptional regulator [Altibacter lentus]MCW8981300.1 Rrf2 family transcriptional regulator [Altibacter sp.]
MLLHSSKYAVKALVYLVANASEEHKLLVKEIAEATDIPKAFLSKLFQQLAAKNYISSTKGRHGGFYLTEAQLKNSVLDIIIEMEGKDRLQECVLNLDNCDAENPCAIHELIVDEKTALRERFKNITLAHLKE